MVDAVGTTHHVKIGDDFHLIRPGTYRKQGAPLFGARFTTGDPDYNTLNLWQYWAQRCWVGGFGAETWMDDAMFDEGVGVDTSQHEVMVLSRDLGPSTGRLTAEGNWDIDSQNSTRELFTFNGKLYCLSYGNTDGSIPARLHELDADGPQYWIQKRVFPDRVRSVCVFSDSLIFGDGGVNLTRMDEAGAFSSIAKPGGRTETPYTLSVFRGKLYVPFGRRLYRMKPDFTWDGSTAFYTAEGIDYFRRSELHLGFLYFSSQNGHILRTDGNNTFDLWSFEPHVQIWGMRSFDGRLFIGASEELEGTNSTQAVLYQFSGAAVTELKRWGKVGADCTPGRLRAFESSLFFGASSLLGMGDGFGIGRYDPREDAYHIFASNADTVAYPAGTEQINWRVDDVAYYKGYLYCAVYGFGVFRTKWSFKDVSRDAAMYDTTRSGSSIASLNGGWATSSDFDAGTPGLRKLWDAITVHADLPHPSCSVFVEVSTDGGRTYSEAGTLTAPVSGYRVSKTLRLTTAEGNPLTGTRIKWRLTLRTTNTTQSPQVRGVVVRYLPIPEPNWRWDMSLVLSDHQELLDGSVVADVDVATKLANLEVAFRTQTPIHFTDIDGTQWGAGTEKLALITELREDVRYVGPSSDGVVERDVQLSLIEIKDGYEVLS